MDAPLRNVRRVDADGCAACTRSRARTPPESRSKPGFQSRDYRGCFTDCRARVHGNEDGDRRVCDRRECDGVAFATSDDESRVYFCALRCAGFCRSRGVANTRSECVAAGRSEFVAAFAGGACWVIANPASSIGWAWDGRDAVALDRVGLSRKRHASPALDALTARVRPRTADARALVVDDDLVLVDDGAR